MWAQVSKTPSWLRSWASFSLLQLYSHRNARADSRRLGQPLTPFSLQLAPYTGYAPWAGKGDVSTVRLAQVIPARGRLTRRRRYSHHHATLYVLCGESLMKYRGWCQNDFNVRG